tara:strand:+ start:967 stop:1164 length:198 start_codon:yes stop_codon:yes gene_type:complete
MILDAAKALEQRALDMMDSAFRDMRAAKLANNRAAWSEANGLYNIGQEHLRAAYAAIDAIIGVEP